MPWAVVGAEGEAELAAQAVTVRCLVRPDGSMPDREDEPDLVAITAALVLIFPGSRYTS